MLTMGDIRRTHLTAYGPDGITADTTTYDQDLFQDACIAELADFADSVRTGRTPYATGHDASAALAIALAAVRSVTTGAPVHVGDLGKEHSSASMTTS
ncbi:Gfo/Idh/MocA family oxidoreductase [Streptomyces chartreusis]|uniref:Gfo/Idh/MocA family oxidoreductase n=1 Tax=Streptomyces chartreusis TaxID=1969 RepID=UPI002E8232B1|nr:Gfo/Idh/MocA family oxidoreductase [Streptomyces chartreusis]WUB19218.1 hypothetical protein OG997_22005 [Streptomyces chartreusis]